MRRLSLVLVLALAALAVTHATESHRFRGMMDKKRVQADRKQSTAASTQKTTALKVEAQTAVQQTQSKSQAEQGKAQTDSSAQADAKADASASTASKVSARTLSTIEAMTAAEEAADQAAARAAGDAPGTAEVHNINEVRNIIQKLAARPPSTFTAEDIAAQRMFMQRMDSMLQDHNADSDMVSKVQMMLHLIRVSSDVADRNRDRQQFNDIMRNMYRIFYQSAADGARQRKIDSMVTNRLRISDAMQDLKERKKTSKQEAEHRAAALKLLQTAIAAQIQRGQLQSNLNMEEQRQKVAMQEARGKEQTAKAATPAPTPPPRPVRPAQSCLNLYIMSAGWNAGNDMQLQAESNVFKKTTNWPRGLSLMVVDPRSKRAVTTATYDVYASTAASDQLAGVLNSVANGHIIMLSCMDECTNAVTGNLRNTLRGLGATFNPQFRWSWAGYGVKGQPGTWKEQAQNTPRVEMRTRLCVNI